jgi:hypothetical protein
VSLPSRTSDGEPPYRSVKKANAVSAVAPDIDCGLGVFAHCYDASDPKGLVVTSPTHRGLPNGFADLRVAIARINLRDGKPWLDDGRIAQAVSALERIAAPKLIEANQQATELLMKGLVVGGLPDWDQGRSKTVHYIDWDTPQNNTFTVVNQFRVDCPGGMAKGFIVPDLVLFVNGTHFRRGPGGTARQLTRRRRRGPGVGEILDLYMQATDKTQLRTAESLTPDFKLGDDASLNSIVQAPPTSSFVRGAGAIRTQALPNWVENVVEFGISIASRDHA